MDRVKNKILTAVYGGSFNPFGNHHQEVIRSLVACGYQVIVVPAVAHALKPNLLSYHHRYNMAKISVEDLLTQMVSNGCSKDVKVKLSNAEVDLLRKQKPPIRTYELLQEIRQNIGSQHELKFAIGPDIHDEIHKWKNVSKIEEEFGFIHVPSFPMRSTKIREMINLGDDNWSNHVPARVCSYINQHRLYT